MNDKQLVSAFIASKGITARDVFANNLYWNTNGALYSYGPHFPLATFFDGGTVQVNREKYSKTTSRHAGLVTRTAALAGLTVVQWDL